MALTKQKNTVSRSDAETAFAEYATIESQEAELETALEQEITELRRKCQPKLDELARQKERHFKTLQVFAELNPPENKKTIAFPYGVIGFSSGRPSLGLLDGFDWKKVTALLKKKLPDYIRTSEEVAKDKILADRDKVPVLNVLGKVGLEIKTGSSIFFVRTKTENLS